MREMTELHPDAAAYLSAIPPSTWALSASPCQRFGVLTSNVAESFNAWIHDNRDAACPFQTIVALVRQISKLYHERREDYATMEGSVTRIVQAELNETISKARRLTVKNYSLMHNEVESTTKPGRYQIVNLEARTCTCRFFQEYGRPCVHACAAILKSHLHPLDFFHESYYVTSLRNVYAGVTIPVDVDALRNDETTLPPVAVHQSGRPRNVRMRVRGVRTAEGEGGVTCSQCHQLGHNCRTCDRRRVKT